MAFYPPDFIDSCRGHLGVEWGKRAVDMACAAKQPVGISIDYWLEQSETPTIKEWRTTDPRAWNDLHSVAAKAARDHEQLMSNWLAYF